MISVSVQFLHDEVYIRILMRSVMLILS